MSKQTIQHEAEEELASPKILKSIMKDKPTDGEVAHVRLQEGEKTDENQDPGTAKTQDEEKSDKKEEKSDKTKDEGGEKEDDEDDTKGLPELRMQLRRQSTIKSLTTIDVEPGRGSILQDKLNEEQIAAIYQAFLKAPNMRMDSTHLREALEDCANFYTNEEDFDVLFVKMDTTRDGVVDWDEFVSHILLEFQEKEMANMQQELKLPLEGYPRVLRTHHRHPVARVTFCPAVLADRSTSFLDGKYVTVSRDGMINYWSLDYERLETVYSDCPELKVRPTWVTDVACMPDVNIMCTSSTERDLRFYDTTARKFELRIMISSWEHAIVCMHYYFDKNINEDSRLILGDTGGNVRIMMFNSRGKGPFYHKPGVDLIHLRYEALARGELKGMRLIEFRDIHTDWVRQVSYYIALKSFMSCSPCPEGSLYMRDALGTKTQYSFNVAKGVSCFNFEEESHIIVTGGPDCIVRVWNAFVPSKASSVFQGHHAAIVSIILQEAGQRIFSLSKDKCIKVWDVAAQACIQTYISMPPELGEHTPLATFYNTLTRTLIVASMKLAVIVLGTVIDEETTDGYTHTMPVIKALYNPLFKCIVTVGLDSCIMVWDPWVGKRMFLVKQAHTRMSYGEPKAVEITAATFDPGYQMLLTGARDGTLKVWNFNTGTCVRTMNIEKNCEVTSVIWLRNRILAVGWNRHVTEFADKGKYTYGKNWEMRHTDDVLCTACRMPQALATSSYTGELILWRLETGQAYKRYLVSNPFSKFVLSYIKKSPSRESVASMPSSKSRSSTPQSSRSRISISSSDRRISRDAATVSSVLKGATQRAKRLVGATAKEQAKKARRVSVIQLPASGAMQRPLSVHAMLFLNTRPMKADVATLLVALENGNVQLWSHHSGGGYIGQFFAIHMAGDYVVSMATDPNNEYLFSGTTMGYIKIWLMINFGLQEDVKICMPVYRLQFPFLWRDRIEGRAKRSLRDQKWPLLLSSYRAHLRAVNYLEFLPSCKIVISCSSDTTVRLWTLGGRYLGTLGTFRPWRTLRPNVEPTGSKFRIPPDIQRVGSASTMKVLKGGEVAFTHLKLEDDSELLKDLPKRLVQRTTYGQRVTSPLLGKFFKLPSRIQAPSQLPSLDSSLPQIPVYCHIQCYELGEVKRPPTPESILRVQITKTKPQTPNPVQQESVTSTMKKKKRKNSKVKT